MAGRVVHAHPALRIARGIVPWAIARRAAAAAWCAWLVAFSPQMAVWYVLYGQPFTVPQGPSFMQWASPHHVAVLFSDNHGLFSWAPLLLLSLVGLSTS